MSVSSKELSSDGVILTSEQLFSSTSLNDLKKNLPLFLESDEYKNLSLELQEILVNANVFLQDFKVSVGYFISFIWERPDNAVKLNDKFISFIPHSQDIDFLEKFYRFAERLKGELQEKYYPLITSFADNLMTKQVSRVERKYILAKINFLVNQIIDSQNTKEELLALLKFIKLEREAREAHVGKDGKWGDEHETEFTNDRDKMRLDCPEAITNFMDKYKSSLQLTFHPDDFTQIKERLISPFAQDIQLPNEVFLEALWGSGDEKTYELNVDYELNDGYLVKAEDPLQERNKVNVLKCKNILSRHSALTLE